MSQRVLEKQERHPFLAEGNKHEILRKHASPVFLYDPEDRSRPTFLNHASCLAYINDLQAIPQDKAYKVFRTALQASDENKLLELVRYQRQQLLGTSSRGDFAKVAEFRYDLNK